MQLTRGYELSFIDAALRPSSYSTCTGDLYICSAYVASSAQLAVYPGPAGFSQCHADTNYVTGYANISGQSLVGTTLCVTTGNRVAACYVTADTTQTSSAAPGLTMNITVYATK